MGATKREFERAQEVEFGMRCEDCGKRPAVRSAMGRIWCRECLSNFSDDYNQYLERGSDGYQ